MKKKKIIIIISILILLFMFIGVIMIFEGTPWGYYAAKKEITEYINNKFENQAIIKKIYFDFERGGYSAKLTTNDGTSTNFVVYHINNKLRDDYFIRKWENEIDNHLLEFSNNIFQVHSIINWWDSNLYEQYGDYTILQLPDYFSLMNQLKIYTDLTVNISNKFDQFQDYKSLHESIILLKDNFTFNSLYIFFDDKCFEVPYSNLEELITYEDLKRYIK